MRCPGYDTKLHLMVWLRFWRYMRVWCISSFPLLPDPLRIGVIVPVRVPSI